MNFAPICNNRVPHIRRVCCGLGFLFDAAFQRIRFVRHCGERSDAAISKQMLGMTIYYKSKVYNSHFFYIFVRVFFQFVRIWLRRVRNSWQWLPRMSGCSLLRRQ